MVDTVKTIGIGGDFADPILWAAAVGSLNDGNRQVGVLLHDIALTSLFRPNQAFPNGGLLKGNIKLTGEPNQGVRLSNIGDSSRVILSPSGNLDFEDFHIDRTSGYNIQGIKSSTFTRVIAATGSSVISANSAPKFLNSILYSYNYSQSSSDFNDVCVMSNCILIERLVVRSYDSVLFDKCVSLASDWLLGSGTYSNSLAIVKNSYIKENAPINNFSIDSVNNTYPYDATNDFIDFVGGDYRIKASSPLHALGVGAFFEEQINSEDYSATLAFSNGHSIDLSAIKKAVNSIEADSLSSISFVGQKAFKADLSLSTNNIVAATGSKVGRSKLLSQNTASTAVSGYKFSSSNISFSNEVSFTISGVADNIIRKSAILSISNNSECSIIGSKSISGAINNESFNSITLAGIKAAFGQLQSDNNNLIELFPINNFTAPLVRSITIEGKLYLLQIPCNLNNAITIEGKF